MVGSNSDAGEGIELAVPVGVSADDSRKGTFKAVNSEGGELNSFASEHLEVLLFGVEATGLSQFSGGLHHIELVYYILANSKAVGRCKQNLSTVALLLAWLLSVLTLGFLHQGHAGRFSQLLACSHSVVLHNSPNTDSVYTFISPFSMRLRIFPAVFLKSCSTPSPDWAEV